MTERLKAEIIRLKLALESIADAEIDDAEALKMMAGEAIGRRVR